MCPGDSWAWPTNSQCCTRQAPIPSHRPPCWNRKLPESNCSELDYSPVLTLTWWLLVSVSAPVSSSGTSRMAFDTWTACLTCPKTLTLSKSLSFAYSRSWGCTCLLPNSRNYWHDFVPSCLICPTWTQCLADCPCERDLFGFHFSAFLLQWCQIFSLVHWSFSFV